MGFDWKKTIEPNEVIKKEFGISNTYSLIILIGSVLIGMATAISSTLAGFLIIFLGILYWFYLKKSKHFAFTDKRIIAVEYFIGTSSISIDYDKISDIQIEQSLIEQLLNFGSFIVNTSGTHSPQTVLSFVDNPQNLKRVLDEIRDNKSSS